MEAPEADVEQQLGALKQAVALVVGEIYGAFAVLEEAVEGGRGGGGASEAELVQLDKIKAVAQFLSLGKLGGDGAPDYQLQEMKAKMKGEEASAYFGKMLMFSIVEIKCKLGNLQAEMDECTSLERAIFLTKAVRAIKHHLALAVRSDEPDPAGPAPAAADLLELQAVSAGLAQGGGGGGGGGGLGAPDEPPLPSARSLPPASASTQLAVAGPAPGEPSLATVQQSLAAGVQDLGQQLAALEAALPGLAPSDLVSLAFFVSELRKLWERRGAVDEAGAGGRFERRQVTGQVSAQRQAQIRTVVGESLARLRAQLVQQQQAVAAGGELGQAVECARRVRAMAKLLLKESFAPRGPGASPDQPQAASDDGGGRRALHVSRELLSLVQLQALLKQEERSARRVQSDARLVESLQAQLYALNRQRHLLTLAVRNLDLKLSHMIRAKLAAASAGGPGAAEEEQPVEAYQQFNQAANPLGDRRELYERFVSLLRTRPEPLAGLARLVSSSTEADALVTAVTGSLFADTFLASEDYLLLGALRALLAAEIRHCANPDVFLRANSLVPKLLAGYCRRQGPRNYLLQVLTDPVVAILILSKESDLSLEVDPMRRAVALGLLAEDAAWDPALLRTHPEIGEKTAQAQKKLYVFAKKFLEAIVASLPAVPFGLRWLSKTLLEVAQAQFPGLAAERQQILIGSFIFLRFLVPAIITPEPYGIRLANHAGQLDAQTRRNLLLIAKVLQNLANRCPFGEKEPFMMPMNAFLSDHRAPLEAFFEQLVNVGDLGAHFKTVSERKLKKIERTVTIAPAELYLLQRLLHAHRAQLLPDADPLSEVVARLGAPPAAGKEDAASRKYLLLNVINNEQTLQSGSRIVARNPARQALKKQLCKLLVAMRPLDADALGEHPAALSLPDSVAVLGAQLAAPDQAALRPLYQEVCAALEAVKADAGRQGTSAQEYTEAILREATGECKERQLHADFVDTERVELQQAVEYQTKEVAHLEAEKRTFLQYLHNVTQQVFVARTRAKSSKLSGASMIGPFLLALKELEKAGVLVPTEASNQMRAAGAALKLSCTNPGFVNLEVKHRGQVRYYELQPARLLDELLTADTVKFDALLFDLRRLLAFLYKLFGC